MSPEVFYNDGNWNEENILGYIIDKKHIRRKFKEGEIIVKFQDNRQPIKFIFQSNILSDVELFIGQEAFLSKFLKKFGFRDHEIGKKKIDDRFLIKGKNVDWLETFFKDDDVSSFFLEFETLNLLLRDDGKGLQFKIIVPGWIFDDNQINQIYKFFLLCLEKLYKLKIF